MDNNIYRIIAEKVQAPINEKLSPEERMERCLELSDLMTKVATHVICHAIVDYEALMADERLAVANAFLQRTTSTHICNHKLTKEGIVLNYRGETFPLQEAYKTMMLTRSVYEHLVMFYFIYIAPKTDEERRVVWDVWKISSKKNLLSYDPDGGVVKDDGQDKTCEEIEALRKDLFFTHLGMECYNKLDEWTAIGKPTQNGCIEFYRNRGRQDVRRVSYNQAWRHLFGKDQEYMNQLYRLLSIHCHPIHGGLLQYQGQADGDESLEAVPLYLSCCFLAYLCRLFLRLPPGGNKLLGDSFSEEEQEIFKALSRVQL